MSRHPVYSYTGCWIIREKVRRKTKIIITLDVKLLIWGPHKIIWGPHLGVPTPTLGTTDLYNGRGKKEKYVILIKMKRIIPKRVTNLFDDLVCELCIQFYSLGDLFAFSCSKGRVGYTAYYCCAH